MGLDGNIETHDLRTASREELRERIHAALDAGAGRRFILCPSSGFAEGVHPPQQYLDNLAFYIEEGVRYAEEMRP
jgi:hypothetical protein